MMVMVLVLILVLVVVVMALTFGIVALVLIMVMVVVMLVLHGLELGLEAVFVHRGQDLRAAQLLPGSGDETGLVVEGLEDLGGLQGLLRLGGIGAAHHDEVGIGDLVVEELAEVAHVHLGLARVHHGDHGADVGALHAFDRGGHVGQLADAGRLDQDAVGGVIVDDLLESFGEVAHQGAADAAGVHLGDLHAGVLQEAAVDGDLAELVLNEHQLLVLVALRNQLADERGLSGAEEAGENVYSRHGFCVFLPCFFIDCETQFHNRGARSDRMRRRVTRRIWSERGLAQLGSGCV